MTVYVGKGDTRYTTTGKWKIFRDGDGAHEAVIYTLEPDSGKPKSISMLKADDNILFFLDREANFLVGDEYASFTFNRRSNPIKELSAEKLSTDMFRSD